ncbi:MAG TPA: hypothetical protein VIL94_02860 [Acidothermaceae bacterium]
MTTSQSPQLPSASEPFDAWQRASAALRAAEARGAAHDDILRLSEQVIRARNALTLDRTNAGWNAPDDVLRHLLGDELLLTQSDDSRPVARPRPMSSARGDAHEDS